MKLNISKENIKACLKSKQEKPSTSTLTQRAADVQAVVGIFGGYAEAVAKLMTILSGETISVPSTDEHLKMLSVFVPTKCTNNHSYDMEIPVVIITEHNEGLQGKETEIKNRLAPNQGRLATEEEIDSVVDELSDDQIRKIMVAVVGSDDIKFFEE